MVDVGHLPRSRSDRRTERDSALRHRSRFGLASVTQQQVGDDQVMPREERLPLSEDEKVAGLHTIGYEASTRSSTTPWWRASYCMLGS